MSRKVIPLILSTQESVHPEILNKKHLVLYVWHELYDEMSDSIDDSMRKKGYTCSNIPAKKGVYYVRTKGLCRFIPGYHQIHDPYRLL